MLEFKSQFFFNKKIQAKNNIFRIILGLRQFFFNKKINDQQLNHLIKYIHLPYY
jgi:hypothetical protein